MNVRENPHICISKEKPKQDSNTSTVHVLRDRNASKSAP